MRDLQLILPRMGCVTLFLVICATPSLAQLPNFETGSERGAFNEARKQQVLSTDATLKGIRPEDAVQPAPIDPLIAIPRNANGQAPATPEELARFEAKRLRLLDEFTGGDRGPRRTSTTHTRAPGADASFRVNSAYDDDDLDTPDGVCDTGYCLPSGAAECTLGAAIEQANAVVGLDDIEITVDIAARSFRLPLATSRICFSYREVSFVSSGACGDRLDSGLPAASSGAA